MLFLGFCVTVFRIENTGFLTVFTEVLLVPVAVLAVFLQVNTTAATTCIDFLFDYHKHSLTKEFSLNHYPIAKLPSQFFQRKNKLQGLDNYAILFNSNYLFAFILEPIPEMRMQLLDRIEFPPVPECNWMQLVLATRHDKVGLK